LGSEKLKERDRRADREGDTNQFRSLARNQSLASFWNDREIIEEDGRAYETKYLTNCDEYRRK